MMFLDPRQLQPLTQAILATTTTALTMATTPVPTVAMRLHHQHPPQLRPDPDKTPFIIAGVDPALEIAQANRPISEVIPSRSIDKLAAILCTDSRCVNVA
jgi:hypothetical protein